MTTITLEIPDVEKYYSKEEIQIKFYEFLLNDIPEGKVILQEVDDKDLPQSVKEKLKNYDSLNFTSYMPQN